MRFFPWAMRDLRPDILTGKRTSFVSVTRSILEGQDHNIGPAASPSGGQGSDGHSIYDEGAQYAVEAARFHTEWEGQSGCLYVGNEAQVAKAESADALDQIKEAARMLQGDDIGDALHQVMRCAKLPSFKERYFRTSGCACPFCGSKDIMSGPVETDGMIGWARVECTKCGCTWQDVWTVIDMTEVRDADRREIQDDDQEGGSSKQIREEPSTEPRCPQCGKSLECFPDQDGSCDWRCSKCSWSQHVPTERR